jgi:enterochelin esterase-like enzyme
MGKTAFVPLCGIFLFSLNAAMAEKLNAVQLVDLAKESSDKLPQAIHDTFPEAQLKQGTAWDGQGNAFFFSVESSTMPMLYIDDAPGPQMRTIPGTNLWYTTALITELGRLHSFYYLVDSVRFGGRLDMPAFAPLSYLLPGVKEGKLSEKITHTSKIYDGMKSDYWIYVPNDYKPNTPAALMVFQDGSGYATRNPDHGVLNVVDNLIHQKKIPVMICVFINPGKIGDSPGTPTYNFVKAYSEKWHRTLDDSMRSTLYDTVSDRYPRFLRDEILADVASKYNIRKDAYSRAVAGLSSGGICSFNAAWFMPDQFSRVLSWIGSFTAIQWKEDPQNPDGGQDYPEKVLREPHRNIRAWLQDGANDQENPNYGSWPTANIRIANALKLKNYDFHFSFGKGTHSAGQGAAELPEAMIWLWRDYDPAKTEQTYVLEDAEKSRPLFRVNSLARETQ